MQNLTPTPTNAQAIAERVNANLKGLITTTATTLAGIYNDINTSGEQAAIMAYLNTKGATAIGIYDKLQEAVAYAFPEANVPAINKQKFKVKNNGTVDYEP